MSDLSDKALETAEFIANIDITEGLAKAQQRQCDEPRFRSWDHATCYDCGDDIPPPRLALGRVRCVTCQENAEKLERGYVRTRSFN